MKKSRYLTHALLSLVCAPLGAQADYFKDVTQAALDRERTLDKEIPIHRRRAVLSIGFECC